MPDLQRLYSYLQPLQNVFGGRAIMTRKQGRKFFATVSGDHHAAMKSCFELQRLTHGGQAVIARQMTVGVVERFEVVDIDHGNGETCVLRKGAVPIAPEGAIEATPIRKLSQVILNDGLLQVALQKPELVLNSDVLVQYHARTSRVGRHAENERAYRKKGVGLELSEGYATQGDAQHEGTDTLGYDTYPPWGTIGPKPDCPTTAQQNA